MGIADIHAAFQDGLGPAGSCLRARMEYLDGGARQRLTFEVALAGGGDVVMVAAECAASDDLQAVARATAEEWAHR